MPVFWELTQWNKYLELIKGKFAKNEQVKETNGKVDENR